MIVRSSPASSFSLDVLPFFFGKNPSNTNRSDGRPLITRAGINAVAPGRHIILIFFFIDSRISKNPGSEIDGVPASETNANVFPSIRSSTYLLTTLCSLLM